ncbi:MAG: hypothetical protein RIQ79_1157, partial [Verrucomicrobiota bacterium]
MTSEPITDTAKIAAMIPSDQLTGNFPPNAAFSHTILRPTKMSIIPRPYFRKRNLCITPASKKNNARNPKIANMLDVNTIKGSLV